MVFIKVQSSPVPRRVEGNITWISILEKLTNTYKFQFKGEREIYYNGQSGIC